MQQRIVDITTPLGEALWFREMRGTEALSGLFDFELTLHSDRVSIDGRALIGQPMTLAIETEQKGSARHLNGICTRFASAGREGEHQVFHARLRPWLWLASRRSDSKIFQFKTVPDIIAEVLSRYGFPLVRRLVRRYRTWDYCVQYQETDLAFVSRLMEHEGIYYYFEHAADAHRLVLVDDIGSHAVLPGHGVIDYIGTDAATVAAQEHINAWSIRHEIDPGDFHSIDYDFEKPSVELFAKRKDARGHAHDSYQRFEWPGGYTEFADGEHYAQARMEALAAEQERAHAVTTVRAMAPGYTFRLARCPQADQNREYLVVACTYHFRDNARRSFGIEDNDALWEIRLTAQPTRHPYRPQLLTPKPRTTGPQTAVVVGPPGEEIHTDQYGRVKVQFHWDRYGERNEHSSCWIRVATHWAGSRWGAIHIPRIGQEVVVDFLNGDPDYPLITGSVYNAEQMPPWGLPDNKTQSGILTRSTRGGAAGAGMKDGPGDANAIRFEDKKGEEQLWIHAQRDQLTEVERDEDKWVGRDRRKTVDRDETSVIHRDRTETVGRHETITVHGNRTEVVDLDERITIHQNRRERVDLDESVSIGKNRNKDVGRNDRLTVGGNQTVTVKQNRMDTVALNVMENVGIAKMETIGAGYVLNVGAAWMSNVGFMHMHNVGKLMQTRVGNRYGVSVGGGASQLQMDDEGNIVLTGNGTRIVMAADGSITLSAKNVRIEAEEIVDVRGNRKINLNT